MPMHAHLNIYSKPLEDTLGQHNSYNDTNSREFAWDGIVRLEVLIEIKDDGPGISPEDLPYVFDRFYTGSRSRTRKSGVRGSGLGLAITKEIIKIHRGSIWVESKLNQDSVFYFTLPISREGKNNIRQKHLCR